MNVKKNDSIDLIRIFAALGVVLIHVQGNVPEIIYLDKNAGMLCVPFFYTASLIFFISNVNTNVTFNDFIVKNWKRIVIPYLVWTAIYITLLLGKSLITHSHPNIVLWQAAFYGGSAMHLYFLPMLLALQMIALGIVYVINPMYDNRIVGILLLVGVVIYLCIGSALKTFGIINPIHAISYILFGFWAASRIKNTGVNLMYVSIGIFLLCISILANWNDKQFVFLSYIKSIPLGGISIVLICMGAPFNTMPKWLLLVSSLSYGIYLSHVVFLEAFEFILEKTLKGTLIIDIPMKLLIVAVIFIFSAVFTFLARKITISRRLLLGEK